MRAYPYTKLAMKGSEVRLSVEKLGGYLIHEDVWVVNGEGTAFGHPSRVGSDREKET